MIKKINHIGIAVSSIDEKGLIYSDLLGLEKDGEEVVEDQGVRVAFYSVGDVRIELLEPISPDSPIAKFIEKRGEGIHHIAYESDALKEDIDSIDKKGARLIDKVPRKGAHDMDIAFLHPRSTGGVLTELCGKDDKNQKTKT
ncbi:MAG: methylmalonyl-CoA epimerase [Candidatus Zixiibacteriota bacterium]